MSPSPRRILEEHLTATFEEATKRFSTLPGFQALDHGLPFTPPEWLSLSAFTSDHILWGRLLAFPGSQAPGELPSVFSALILPRLRWDLPCLATLQTFTDEQATFTLLDAYALDEEPLAEDLHRQMETARASICPGALSPALLPPALQAQMGPAAWLWRSLDLGAARSTGRDLLHLIDLYLRLLPQVRITTAPIQELRQRRLDDYTGALRTSEERARQNLGAMLGGPHRVDPFLDSFYFPAHPEETPAI